MENAIRTDLVAQLVVQCGDNLWGECGQYPKSDWKSEVENGDTILGYWEWVLSQADSNDIPVESLVGGESDLLVDEFNVFVVVVGEATHQEDIDDEVGGIYAVSVKVDKAVNTKALSSRVRSEIADGVLTEFHDQVGVANLEDFTITLYMQNGQKIDDAGDADFEMDADFDFCGSVCPDENVNLYAIFWSELQPMMQQKMDEVVLAIRSVLPEGVTISDAEKDENTDVFKVSASIHATSGEGVLFLDFLLSDAASEGEAGVGVMLTVTGYNSLVMGGYQPGNYTEAAFVTDINEALRRVNDCDAAQMVDFIMSSCLNDETLLREIAADGIKI